MDKLEEEENECKLSNREKLEVKHKKKLKYIEEEKIIKK